MYILGVHPGHDAGVAIIKDGEIVCAVDEERFVRIKHWSGGIPTNSLNWALNYAKITLDDIDYVTMPSKKYNLTELINKAAKYVRTPGYVFKKIKGMASSEIGFSYYINQIKNLKNKKIVGIDHHTAHAAAAYLTSGLKESVILTLDGVGGGVSGTISIGNKNNIERKSWTTENGSIGHFYEALTEGLGYQINDAEWKVMGLAPYGKPTKAIPEVFNFAPKLNGLEFTHKPWTIRSENINHFWEVHLDESRVIKSLAKRYGQENVAYAGQFVFEKLLKDWVNNILDKFGIADFVAAGGSFLNVKANGYVRDELNVNLFPFPHPGDGGLAVGSALYLYSQLKPNSKFKKIENVYFGPAYSNNEILSALESTQNIKYEKHKNVEKIIAELLAKGKIVSYFQGRMEFGPRALGNRSILANPSDNKYKDIVNKKIKYREWWRPFCPSMLDEAKDEYLINPCESPFMIMSFRVPFEKISEIEAVVHVDGTTRPQTVKKNVNRRYYNLIKNFEKETGTPVILNTSFNRRGEPVVCSPKDALNCFLGSGLEFLAIGDYLVEKV